MSNRQKTDDVIETVMMNRRLFAAELRSGRHEQICATLGRWWEPNAQKCWAGVGLFLFYNGHAESRILQRALGISDDIVGEFIALNDRGSYSFSELADKLDSLPPTHPSA